MGNVSRVNDYDGLVTKKEWKGVLTNVYVDPPLPSRYIEYHGN